MTEEKEPAGDTVDAGTEQPPIPPVSQSPADVSSEELKVKLQSLEKQITDVATENATLRQRLTEVEETPVEEPVIPVPNLGNSDEINSIAELSEINPREAIKKMDELNRRRLSQIQESTQKQNQFLTYVNEVYAKNPELKVYDDFLGAAAKQLIVQGVNPYKAVNMVVETFKKKQKDTKPIVIPEPTPKLPSGARGEQGSNLPPPKEPPPEKEETTADVVNMREEIRRKKAMKVTK